MRGVDQKDALIGNSTSVSKSLKWTTKVGFHFIEKAILNAFILFNKANPGKIQYIHQEDNYSAQPSAQSFNLPFAGRHVLQLIPPTAAKYSPERDPLQM